MITQKLKGRGAQINPANRFEKLHIENLIHENDESFMNDSAEKQIQTSYYKDESKTVISKNDSYDLYFNYSFNPYRGCEHGCIYCYARPTHEYLGFSSGIDFESKIIIKKDAASLLEKQLSNKNYKPDIIMLSGNTDCYQPIERKLGITRKALEVCLKYRNPVSIITKSSLVQRDIDLLKEMAELNLISVMISITSLDRELIRKMEPRTSTPEKRLKVVEELSRNKIPVGVNLAPIIPGLNDNEIPEILREASLHGALFAGYTLLRLPFSVKDLFIDWLEREFPERANKILNRIKDIRGGKLNESEFVKRFTGEGELAEMIHNLFEISCKKYGLNRERVKLSIDKFRNKSAYQLDFF